MGQDDPASDTILHKSRVLARKGNLSMDNFAFTSPPVTSSSVNAKIVKTKLYLQHSAKIDYYEGNL